MLWLVYVPIFAYEENPGDEMSHVMRKPVYVNVNNKDADQPVPDQHLVVCCLDSILPTLAKSKISRP